MDQLRLKVRAEAAQNCAIANVSAAGAVASGLTSSGGGTTRQRSLSIASVDGSVGDGSDIDDSLMYNKGSVNWKTGTITRDDGVERQLNPQEMDELRRERNRMHAKLTRNRRKMFMAEIKQTIDTLEAQNTEMRERVTRATKRGQEIASPDFASLKRPRPNSPQERCTDSPSSSSMSFSSRSSCMSTNLSVDHTTSSMSRITRTGDGGKLSADEEVRTRDSRSNSSGSSSSSCSSSSSSDGRSTHRICEKGAAGTDGCRDSSGPQVGAHHGSEVGLDSCALSPSSPSSGNGNNTKARVRVVSPVSDIVVG